MSHPKFNKAPGEKNDFKGSWKRLITYMRPYRLGIIVSVILAVVGTVFTVIGPDYISEITDKIATGIGTGSIDLEAISAIGIFLLIIYSLAAVLSFGQGWISASIAQKLSKRLRTDISEKINRLPLRYFDNNSYGDVLSRATNDVDNLGQSMNQSLGMLISSLALLVGATVMMIYTNYIMAAAAILSSLGGFALMGIIIGRSQKYFVLQQQHIGEVNGFVEEIYTNQESVAAYNGGEKAIEKFEKINKTLFGSAFKSMFFSGLMMPLMMFVGNFGYVVVCIAGSVLVINGSISIGVVVAFMIYVRLFTEPLSNIAQAAVSMQTIAATSHRIFEFLDEDELENEDGKTKVLKDVKGSVEFRDVHFGYTDTEIIKGFSFKASPGQKIAIVGPTGAGKTTIVNLLMRFYEVNSGEILVDGIPIRELTRENVHSMFGMVLQDTWLFEGTVRDNLVYGKEGVTEEELESVCKTVGIHHFISTLPDGYDSVITEESALSSGQRQQMTIARAMIENAPMLILDEATSSVDTRTEKIIQNAMDNLTSGRTSFIIAHRLSTIRNADTIIVMRDGSIVEHGNHDRLMEAGGFYASLYNSQFEE